MQADELYVLIVDDDADELVRMKRLLRAFRRDWNMQFCQGAEEALDALSRQAYDAVVCQLEMEGVNGAELLGCVRDLYPDAVRLLVGAPERSSSMVRSLGVAHRYLAEPVDIGLLGDSIARAAHLGRRLRKPGLKALVGQIDKLPSLPDVYLALVDELRSEDAQVARVAELLSRDVGMTAKVLQLVNSSFFGLPVHVADVRHAASLLGLNALKPLVLTAGVFRQLEDARVPAELAREVLEHGLQAGGIARQIAAAEGLGREATDHAMLAGVLHDVGKLVLADHFGRSYAKVCLAAEASKLPLLIAEQDQFDATHADIGGFLLSLWGLPQEIVEAVAFHHDPWSLGATSCTPLTAVHAANAVAHGAEDEDGRWILDAERLDAAYLNCVGCAGRIDDWAAMGTPDRLALA